MSIRLRARLVETFRSVVGTHALAVEALTLPVGQISLDEARFLGELVAGLQAPGPIVEIGTLFGFSTRVMTLAKSPTRSLITVDSYEWNPLALPRTLHRRCTEAALADAVRSHKVRVVCQDKAEFYRDYAGEPPALVFFDAVHTYEETKKDLAWARRVGAGVICAHDYGAAHPGVVQAVDEFGGSSRSVGTLVVLRN